MDADAGRFPTGKAGLSRDWDGHAWAIEPVVDPTAPAVPKGGHFVFRSLPFWSAVLATVVGCVVVVIAADPAQPNLWLAALAGLIACGGSLAALTVGVWRRLRVLDAIRAIGARPRTIIALGLLSGAVAIVIAFFVEIGFARLGVTPLGGLFLAGPIEESAKLLVPVVIFFATKKRWADPRVSFGLAWLSGAFFGVAEGVKYVLGIDHAQIQGPLARIVDDGLAVDMVLERVFTELMHPLLTGAAAAAMWLGVWRGRRLLLGGGLVAYLTSIFMHSFNDGVIAGLVGQVSNRLSLVLFALWLTAIYQVFRVRARELVPPSRIATTQPRWRPHVKQHAGTAVPTPTATAEPVHESAPAPTTRA